MNQNEADTNIQRIYGMIDAMTGEDLLLPTDASGQTGRQNLRYGKFISLSMSTPWLFGTFCTKIRKWKKLML